MTKEEADKTYNHICATCFHYTDDKKCSGNGRFNDKTPYNSCKKWRIKHELCDWEKYIEEKYKNITRAKRFWQEQGLPKKEGWYLTVLKPNGSCPYDISYFDGEHFLRHESFIIAWHRITKYKG